MSGMPHAPLPDKGIYGTPFDAKKDEPYGSP
jgi:hypothetical protein